MTKISDTQRAILIAAARREDGAIRSARVKGGAAAKTIQSLIKAGLITDKPFTITADGRAAIGARAAGTLRTDTKQAQVVAMLRGADGATVDEIAAATGWQRHTVRGAIAGALKKKLSLDVISEKIEACLSGCYPHPLHVGCCQAPE